MFISTPTLTNIGKTMLLKAASGEGFEFDGFAIGDGVLDEGETLSGRLDLKNKILDNIAITAVSYDLENHSAQLTGEFTNENGILEDFTWRELGLYAHGQDNVKHLYAYAYENEYAERVPASGSAVLTKQTIIVTVAIGDSDNITVHVKLPDATYAMAEDLDDHVNDQNNPHQVTLEQLGAAPAAHRHSASDITSGILPVERGGTGMNSLDELLGQISQDVVAGVFTGNSHPRRDFSLGFQPSAVIIFPISGGTEGTHLRETTFAPGKNQYHSGCGSSMLTASADVLFRPQHGGAAVTPDGFAIGYGSGGRVDINANGTLYAYIAFR